MVDFDFLDHPEPTGKPKLYVVSTSDAILYKRCRRRWDFQSKNRQSLNPIGGVPSGPLWLGTGFHFALEDYYGYKLFKDPMEALRAYASAHKRRDLPDDWEALVELGCGMFEYYTKYWLPQHGEVFETLWEEGPDGSKVPQVEVNVRIPLDIPPPPGYDGVAYSTTYDRIAFDEHGRIIVVDYKTAGKAYEAGKLELDPQVSRYIWSARLLYGDRVEGAAWMQFLKAVPDAPEPLKNGELSVNKNQYTTHAIYRDTLIEYYGEVPKKYIDFLNHLASLEHEDGDRYIRREIIYRNQTFADNEERKIFQEVDEMLREDLPLFPNPTRDCTWDCNYRAMCLAMDDGSDWEYMRDSEYEKWEGEGYKSTDWRERLEYPPVLEHNLELAS